MRLVRHNGTIVKLSSGNLLVLDNGPMSFGGWAFQEIKSGAVLEKKIAVSQNQFKGKSAKIAIPFVFESPGQMSLEINGKKKYIIFKKKGFYEEKIELGTLDRPEIKIKILSINYRGFFIVDYQRNYGRTSIDRKTIPGELVCRIYIEE
jgi:hypothetical protein